ncbi:Butyrophilin subfamily 2 member A2 [Labeo rohita]|uniref:Butyrophilin subfamily 2 member A2 n=1 Tax=Labeo rohita TaxID=84645 RepID=A0ABQ8L3S6_LABRO|nr:Butyrophilin subfamily 2 member A2 [Labeo rohita]
MTHLFFFLSFYYSNNSFLSLFSLELSVVCQSDIVFSHPGDDVVLSCHLKPAISAASMEIQWWHKEDLVFYYKKGQVTVNIDFEGRVSLPLQDLQNGNVSLTLRDVKKSQKGLYICNVIHETVDFSLVVPTGPVSAAPGENVILPVHLSPESSVVSMEIRWFKGTELIYQYTNRQEMTNNDYKNRVSLSIQELERGSLTLTLRNVQQADSGVYTCKVIHDGCQKRGIVHLQVREIERVKHLCGVLKQTHEDITQQKVKLEEIIKLLEETLNHDVQDHSKLERCDMRTGEQLYMSFFFACVSIIVVEGEHGSQSTIQPKEEITATEQELSFPDSSSQVLQRLKRSEVVCLTERATQTQQSHEATREETTQSHSPQTLERPKSRGQRRQEKRERKCHIL